MDPFADLSALPKRGRPRRKVVKKHVADILEKMIRNGDTSAQNVVQMKQVAQQKAQEIDQVCYFQYGDDGNAYQMCISKQIEENAQSILNDNQPISASQQFMIAMITKLPMLNDLLANDKFWTDHPELNKSDVQWLVNFIEMVNKRPTYDGIEQNISITYFSSFVPLTEKIDKIQKEETLVTEDTYMGFISPPALNSFEDEWMFI